LDAGGPALACRLTRDHLLLLTCTTNAKAVQDRLASIQQGPAIILSDVTSAYAGFCLLGRAAEDVLRRLTSFDVALDALPVGSCAETNLAGVHALLVRPPGLAQPSLWVYVAWDLGEYVWERIWDAGQACRLKAVGLAAWRHLMLAKAAPRHA
jgi:heterotetrameric sarcosine oxidase gamma subunit